MAVPLPNTNALLMAVPLPNTNALLMAVPLPNTEPAQRAFCVTAPSIWNALAVDTRLCNTIATFK